MFSSKVSTASVIKILSSTPKPTKKEAAKILKLRSVANSIKSDFIDLLLTLQTTPLQMSLKNDANVCIRHLADTILAVWAVKHVTSVPDCIPLARAYENYFNKQDGALERLASRYPSIESCQSFIDYLYDIL